MTDLNDISNELITIHNLLTSAFDKFLIWTKSTSPPPSLQLKYSANICQHISDKSRTLQIKMLMENWQRKPKLPTIFPCIHCAASSMEIRDYESGNEWGSYIFCNNCSASNGHYPTDEKAINAHNALYIKLNPENLI